MPDQLVIGGFEIDVTKKDIKNLHLTVHPPTGKVRISAPSQMDIEVIKAFALTKLDWIKRHHQKMINQARESRRELINRESLHVWGKRYLLELKLYNGGQRVEINGKSLVLRVKENETAEKREDLLEKWYRDEIRASAQPMMLHWQKRFCVKVNNLFIQRMKTKWGSCNPSSKSVRLNTELIHKPKEALEYVIVHEIAHLIEPRHSDGFYKLMDDALPKWRTVRQRLNEAPLSYATWARMN